MRLRGYSNQREWAKLGAQTRLAQLDREREEILAAFPALGRNSQGASTPPGRRRRTISAAGRRAMSLGMKRHWAKRRAARKATTKAS
jgi:hypothetical protein